MHAMHLIFAQSAIGMHVLQLCSRFIMHVVFIKFVAGWMPTAVMTEPAALLAYKRGSPAALLACFNPPLLPLLYALVGPMHACLVSSSNICQTVVSKKIIQ
jgi:hypothetical protein